ncbi:MAG: tRNA isopentenyl-2-thiomethyl-A-37 hydroxylase MiaE [Vulcanimicrobiota bacterium]
MIAELPLHYHTPDRWADQALESVLELLNDHAHLERKAASNALELLNRWPDPEPPERWVTNLASVARDETDHLFLVARLLKARGGCLSKMHRNDYARSLRALVRRGQGPLELIDRLLVSALIELRSCERFEILSRCCQDPELARVYRSLWGSEHGHYKLFLALAEDLVPAELIQARWQEMLGAEAEVIKTQPPGPALHSSVGGA